MKAVETVQAQMQEVASSHQAACPAFFQDVEALCSTAASYLAQLQKNADVADTQKLRTAALKMRLNQLAKDRRSREATVSAILTAKQRELERLLQNGKEEQQQSPASAAPVDPSFSTPITSPFSKVA